MLLYPDIFNNRIKPSDEYQETINKGLAILKRLRGPNKLSLANGSLTLAEMRDLLASEFGAIQYELSQSPDTENVMAIQAASDSNVKTLYDVAQSFYENKNSKIYKVSPAFAKALSKIKDTIRYELLPDEFHGYVPTPSGVFKDFEGLEISGIYISLTNYTFSDSVRMIYGGNAFTINGLKEKGIKDDEIIYGNFGKKLLRFTILSKTPVPKIKFIYEPMSFKFTVRDGDSPKSLLQHFRENSPNVDKEITVKAPKEPTKSEIELLSFVVNLISYIHSFEPDVSEFKPTHLRTANENKKIHREYEDIDCSYPTVFVSWNYGKERKYSTDSTWVDAHLRWQRCGPGMRDTKLIMVVGHERTYVKTETLNYATQHNPRPT